MTTQNRPQGDTPGDAPPATPHGLVVTGRLMWLCFTPLAMVLLGNVMLALPQIREGLWAFDDGEGDKLRRQALFVLAFAFWALTAWYVARLTLGRRFPHDDIGTRGPVVERVAKWLPRLLGLAACLPLALYTLGTGRHTILATLLVGVSAVFLVFTWQRRRLFSGAGAGHYRYFDALSPGSRRTLLVAFALPWGLMLAIAWSPIEVGRWVGAPALVLWAIGGWTLFGGMVLSYAPRTRGWLSLVWLPPVVLVAVSPWADNHAIDWLGRLQDPLPDADVPRRPDLKSHYLSWMAQHPADQPVYLVANAGGASRAAYWGAVALGHWEDRARQSGGRFGANIFLMSGVSGGSVGLVAYAAALRAWPAPAAPTSGSGAGAGAACIQAAVSRFLAKDVLSPVGGLMLYPDLLMRFVPVGTWVRKVDRSRGLEQAWAMDWADLVVHPMTGCPKATAGSGDTWKQPLLQAFEATSGQPALALNTARLEDSRPVMQATVDLGLPDTDDLLAPGLDRRAAQISVAGAAHNSARFPLVSPPGTVHVARRVDAASEPGSDTGAIWGHLGDGGYHEVSGADTLVGVLERLLALGCLRQVPSALKGAPAVELRALKTCGTVADDNKGSRVVVVLLDGAPQDFPRAWKRGVDGQMRDWTRTSRNQALRPAQPVAVPEVMGPLTGLFAHSGQARRRAEDRLSDLAGSDPRGLIALRQPRYRDQREPSMNWQLDDDSRRLMDCALTLPGSAACGRPGEPWVLRPGGRALNLADEALLNALARLQAWVVQPATAEVVR